MATKKTGGKSKTQFKPRLATSKEAEAPVVKKPEENQLRYRELVERVSVKTGMRKQEVRAVLEAALSVVEEAVVDERAMALPPLGRLKVQRTKEVGENRVSILKLRHKKTPDAP